MFHVGINPKLDAARPAGDPAVECMLTKHLPQMRNLSVGSAVRKGADIGPGRKGKGRVIFVRNRCPLLGELPEPGPAGLGLVVLYRARVGDPAPPRHHPALALSPNALRHLTSLDDDDAVDRLGRYPLRVLTAPGLNDDAPAHEDKARGVVVTDVVGVADTPRDRPIMQVL